MSDPMRRPMPGGAPPDAPTGGAVNALRQRESIMNPVDMAQKVTRGDVRPGMSIRDFLGNMGIDVDGPIEQLGKSMLNQARNAGPLSKIRNAAGGMPAPGGPPVGRGMPQAPTSGGGLADLMSKLGG